MSWEFCSLYGAAGSSGSIDCRITLDFSTPNTQFLGLCSSLTLTKRLEMGQKKKKKWALLKEAVTSLQLFCLGNGHVVRLSILIASCRFERINHGWQWQNESHIFLSLNTCWIWLHSDVPTLSSLVPKPKIKSGLICRLLAIKIWESYSCDSILLNQTSLIIAGNDKNNPATSCP